MARVDADAELTRTKDNHEHTLASLRQQLDAAQV